MSIRANVTSIITDMMSGIGAGKRDALIKELCRYIENETDRARDQGFQAGQMVEQPRGVKQN